MSTKQDKLRRNPLVALGEKLELVPRSAMLNSRHSLVRRLGHLAFALLMLSSVRRTKWLYSRGRIPAAKVESRPPRPISDSDLDLCRRLISAYEKACAAHPEHSKADGIWGWIFDVRQRELASALSEKDPARLATLLASMHAEDFVLGMSSGPLIRQTRSRLGLRAWSLKCLDGIASLAEARGAVPVENPEQGGAGLAFRDGLPELLKRLEENLGFRIDLPDIGAPSGIDVDGRLLSPDTPDQIYAALQLGDAIALYTQASNGEPKRKRIVEIGGGYGAMCFWFFRTGVPLDSYTIIDLPIVNVLQGYFLAKALGPDRVHLYGDPEAPAGLHEQIWIMPDFSIGDISDPVDIVVNKDSLPEMPAATMNSYLEWIARNCAGLFYSYNQETGMEFLGEPQGAVHAALSRTTGLRRVSRNKAWVREGYVEEIYLPIGASAESGSWAAAASVASP